MKRSSWSSFPNRVPPQAIVAHARTSSFASVTFPGTPEVARFLSRIAHAYADEKGTLIARLLPKEARMDEIPTLPALPAPNLTTTNSTGEELESGNLMVFWVTSGFSSGLYCGITTCGIGQYSLVFRGRNLQEAGGG